QLSKEAGITYRYGSPAAVNNSGIPTLANPPSNFFRCNSSGQNCISSWEIGGPYLSDPGLYSTNQAHVGFVADDVTKRVGVGDLQISAIDHNTFAQVPHLPWQNAAAWDGSGGRDTYNASVYKKNGQTSGSPVAVTRCGGRAGFCAGGLVVFQDGLIGTVGSNTANNQATAKLPANKVPTGIASTNNSEYALVTVWDTTAMKGQVAVISMAGLCNGCDPYNRNGDSTHPAYYDWWQEWDATYPGLPNTGNTAFMKILGYIDLPGMNAPTEIAVTTGFDQFKTVLGGGLGMARAFSPLTNQSNRNTFFGSGQNVDRYAKAGVAVVISKSEKKAVFINLKPLFDYVNNVYFSNGPTEFTNLGQADYQWPYTFGYKPQQMPTVISTVTLDDRPTAVKTTTYGNLHRAWIATESGSLRIYGLGNAASGAVTAADTVEKGRVVIGKNPTSLATSKGEPDDTNMEPLNHQVLVASRGDRKIQWVRFANDGNSGSVVRTLQDSRIIDPIAVEDADNFSNVGNLLSIADYAGKKVSNYRYGPVFLSDRQPGAACQPPGGCPVTPTGSVKMEFGGSYTTEGKPFHLKTSNVP
ncbi:MAG: hypothetical protein KKC79_02530, partial [Gammaproteobacteria bacterium]|nr:hypothetical protein [Gammaproteobacteria bacterium]